MRSFAASGAVFFLGVTLIGLGIAIVNVGIPAVVRLGFRTRIAQMMNLYSVVLQLGATAGAALTAPMMDGLGWSWQLALGSWAGLVIPALVACWLAIRREPLGRGAPGDVPATVGFGDLLRRGTVWATTAVMGLQALTFFSLITWLPQLLQDRGLNASLAGLLLGCYTLFGMLGSVLSARALALGSRSALWVLLASTLLGYGLLLGGVPAAVAGTMISGTCGGAWLTYGLWFITDQPVPAEVPAISALAQGAGYLLAAVGPLAVGAIYSAVGGWTLPLALLAVAMVGCGAAAVWLSAPRPRRAGAAAGS